MNKIIFQVIYKENKIIVYSDYCMAFYLNADEEVESKKCKSIEDAKHFLDSILEQKDLNKEFPIGFKNLSISRCDYESMPCPMIANNWTDEQMTQLANCIKHELEQYSFDETDPYYEDDLDDAFWKEMESCAVHLGMEYYEDLKE